MVSVNRGAEAASDVMYAEAARSIGGTKLAGRKWGTFTRKATSNLNPQAMVAYRGPVHWFESGTKPHTIISKKYGSTRRRRSELAPGLGMFKGRKRGALRFGGRFSSYSRHPGMRARPFFNRAVRGAVPVTTRVVKRSLVDEPLKVFR